VHQINNAIARGDAIPSDEAKQAAAQTLERIIDPVGACRDRCLVL